MSDTSAEEYAAVGYLEAMGRGGTLYAVLGVERDADAAELRRAYRRRARQTHPDHGGSVGAFTTVREVYEVLADPRRRAEYDARTAAFRRKVNPPDTYREATPQALRRPTR